MNVLGLEYSSYEIYDLIYFFVLTLTLPIGMATQVYEAIKINQKNKITQETELKNKSAKKSKKAK